MGIRGFANCDLNYHTSFPTGTPQSISPPTMLRTTPLSSFDSDHFFRRNFDLTADRAACAELFFSIAFEGLFRIVLIVVWRQRARMRTAATMRGRCFDFEHGIDNVRHSRTYRSLEIRSFRVSDLVP